MTPRKYPTEKKTTTKEGYREYKKLQMRDYREHQSNRKAKSGLQKRYEKHWNEMVKKKFSPPNLEFSGDWVKDIQQSWKNSRYIDTMGVVAIISLSIRDKTEEIDNLDEVNKIYKEADQIVQDFLTNMPEE
jgi:hypothetical protein